MAGAKGLPTLGDNRSATQSVVDPFAGRPCCVCKISESSNSFRSLVNPALHVGKQIGGGVGWRAWDGRTGMAGGCTTTGGKGRELVAQPLTSIDSRISIGASTRHDLVGFIDGFLHLCGAALFLGACGIHRLAAGLLQIEHGLRVAHFGGFQLLPHAPALNRPCGERRGDTCGHHDGGNAGGAQ